MEEMGLTDILAGIADAGPTALQPLVLKIGERFGYEALQESVESGLDTDDPLHDPFGRGLRRASEVPCATELNRLWFRMYPAMLILLVGETGAGKSSLLYNLAIHAAWDEPLYGVPFGLGRRLVVLYIDPENAGNWEDGHGGVCAQRMERIGKGRPDGLYFHNGQGVDLSSPRQVAALKDTIQQLRVDLLILDPLANIFATEDENSNAEAARQMKALNALARETGVCIVACHHTGKSNGGMYGRGASARMGAADVGMMFRVQGEVEEADDDYQGEGHGKERDDVCRLQVVKNRVEGKDSLFLRMAGNDRFDRVDFRAWRQAGQNATQHRTRTQQAEMEILNLLLDGEWHTRTQILEQMSSEGPGRGAVDRALHALTERDAIRKRIGERGAQSYQLVSEASTAA